jgi:hypothetical protein
MYEIDVMEIAYTAALESVAMGEHRNATRRHLLRSWPTLSPDDADAVLSDALNDALASGVEREDIDASWL